MSSDTKNNREELRRIEMKLLERYEHISGSFGVHGLKAKLLSILFISTGKPRSLTELADLTHFSKPSVSRTMRELEIEIPFIIAVKKPQDKEKYYTINIEFTEVITGFLVKVLEEEAIPTLEGTAQAIESLEQLRKSVVDEKMLEEIDSFIERAKFVNRTYKKYLWIVERLLVVMDELEKKYYETHPDELDAG